MCPFEYFLRSVPLLPGSQGEAGDLGIDATEELVVCAKHLILRKMDFHIGPSVGTQLMPQSGVLPEREDCVHKSPGVLRGYHDAAVSTEDLTGCFTSLAHRSHDRPACSHVREQLRGDHGVFDGR